MTTAFGKAARSTILFTQELLQLLLGGTHTRLKLNVEDRKFAGIFVRLADSSGELDGRMLIGRLFDDCGIDIVAAANDQILHPAGDPQIAVRIDAAEIAGPEPAVGRERAGTVIEVAIDDDIAASDQLPNFVGRANPPIGVVSSGTV